MAKPTEKPFGVMTRVSPTNHVLDEGSDPPQEGALLKGVSPIYGTTVVASC